MRKPYYWLGLTLLALANLPLAHAKNTEEERISTSEKSDMITALNHTLKTHYIFPDKAHEVSEQLDQKLQNGGYRSIKTKGAFANMLSTDLGEFSKDLHFLVGIDPEWIKIKRTEDTPAGNAEAQKAEQQESLNINHGFNKTSILDGNIAYVRFSYFSNPEYGDDTAAATMKFVENADAIIFDLRYNNGGYMEMVQFLASYLLPHDKEQMLFDYYYADDGKRIERSQWVLPSLPGKRMPNTPVYILTSNVTFSAAEWFAYTLQKLERATLIGGRTAGGAHPVDRKIIDDDFFVQVPIGEIKDPVDGSDFEGTGVEPDHKTTSFDALAYAHKLALENLTKTNPDKRADYEWLLPVITARTNPPTITEADLQKLVGKYEGREITLNKGTLYYRWRDRYELALTPLSANLFAVEGVDDFRFQLATNNDQKTGLERVVKNGQNHVYKIIE